MTGKAWGIFAALCVAILGGMIFMAQGDKIDVSNIDGNKLQSASTQNGNIGEHIEGKTDSKVVLIEYGDYQCPGCGTAYPIMKNIATKYKDKVAFVFRNFPLYSIHPNAFAAATVAEAAGLQGKFEQMHDKLYESQSSWRDLTGAERTNYFLVLGGQLGLNTDKMKADLDSANIKKKIDFDTALGKKAQVTGTPAFYLNGKSVGDQYVLDGKIVPKDTKGASLIWADQATFENLVLNPALKEAGIELPQ